MASISHEPLPAAPRERGRHADDRHSSVVPVALFALFATGGIAKYGFGRRA